LSVPPLSLLCDLRPAFDGHYGIPSEARLMFSLLHDLPDIKPTGLINHPAKVLQRSLAMNRLAGELTPARRMRAYSRLAASTGGMSGRQAELGFKAFNAARLAWFHISAKLGIGLPLDQFDGTEFGDFLWQSLFSKSLPPSDFDRCRSARYVALWAPWNAMHATSLLPGLHRYARVDTRGYDMFVAQTPWPGRVDAQTRLVIRYHDATPVFLPHTVKQSRLHQFFHMSALSENAKSACFACVSEFSRSQLLKIFPEVEKRAFVVYDSIGDDYFPSDKTHEAVPSIITNRIDPSTEPNFGSPTGRQAFYNVHLPTSNFKYILAVGALEPRKNYGGLLQAWERLRCLPNRPTAIVCVSSAGWNNSDLKFAMRRWQAMGELFHLSSVSSSEMRTLYSSAEAVVCPSISEGFDLPGVEAIRCGAPVAASDIPVHREILGDAALYFDPYSAESMSDTIARFLGGTQLKASMQRAIETQAAKFSKAIISNQWQHMLESCRAMPPAAD
jgi:glycosyltransferase involved in cell wall biosynthesis